MCERLADLLFRVPSAEPGEGALRLPAERIPAALQLLSPDAQVR